MTEPMHIDVNLILAEMQTRLGALIQENAVLAIVNRQLTTELESLKAGAVANS